MDYAGLAATASRLIDASGRNVTLRRVTPPTYSPATDTNSGGSAVNHTVKAVFTRYRVHEIDGEIIRREDKRVLIAGIQPVKGDLLIDGSTTYTVLDVEAVHPGDTALLWKAQARK